MIWLLAASCQSGGAAEPAPPAPLFDKSCVADAECAVVLAVAGLEEIPADPKAARCGTACFTAVRAADVEAWDKARASIEAQIPCDKKLAKCGMPSSRRAVCSASRCAIAP